jgi:hypothetical protein
MHHYLIANFLACIIILFLPAAGGALPRENMRECYAKCRATSNVCLNRPQLSLSRSGKVQVKDNPQHDRMCGANYYKCSDRCKGTKHPHT